MQESEKFKVSYRKELLNLTSDLLRISSVFPASSRRSRCVIWSSSSTRSSSAGTATWSCLKYTKLNILIYHEWYVKNSGLSGESLNFQPFRLFILLQRSCSLLLIHCSKFDSSHTFQFERNVTKLCTLNPSFLIANITSIMYWTRLSISALWRMFRSLSKTAMKKTITDD